MLEADGVGLYCLACRAAVAKDRRDLALCRQCMKNPAVVTGNPRNKGRCADCLAKRAAPLNPTSLDKEIDRQENVVVIADLLRMERELRG